MVVLRSPRLALVWLAVGLVLSPFLIGSAVTLDDFVIRLPAFTLVLIDAGLTLQAAFIYQVWVWPRQSELPLWAQFPFFRPMFSWIGALGYYVIAAWVLRAIIVAPDIPVTDKTAYMFLSGYAFIMVWKSAYLAAISRLAVMLDDRLPDAR
jgi:hypothetical protein